MAATNYSPISLYYSTTSGATPSAVNLVGGELALNSADGKLFYKDSGGTVQVLATKGTGPIGGSNTQVQYNSSGSLAGSANLTFDGTTLTAAGLSTAGSVTLSGGTANGVAYLNGSKVVTTGSALTFDGTNLGLGTSPSSFTGYPSITINGSSGGILSIKNNGTEIYRLSSDTSGTSYYTQSTSYPHVWGQSSTEQMRLTSTGLGIGTSSPARKLDVNGTIRVADGQSVEWGGTSLYIAGTSNTFLFGTSSAERMRLDSSGNLGLGVTPSAWATFKALQIASGSLAAVGTQTQLIQNAYWDGTNWKYINSSGALRYGIDTFSNAHAWYTAASGTAGNAITFTQAMTLDASGNLLLGTTSAPNNWGAATPKMRVTDGGIQIGSYGLIAEDVFNTDSLCLVTDITENICFGQYTVSGSTYTERMRIDSSGNVLVGTTSQIFSGKFCVSSPLASTNSIALQNTSTQAAGQSFMYMANSAGNKAGSIDHSGTTTVAYTTSSDYRLKENIVPMTGALSKVVQLTPVTYTWKEDGTAGQGFIAHELQAVVPECVVGEKDAVDADGNPVYQGIDTSFLVATLTAALQEMKAIIDSQAERIAALEAK